MQAPHSNQFSPELCIVGSSCTLYQDEMKYLEMEQGLHLIPWMGNTTLLVDRYDARGFLDDQLKFGLKSNFKYRPSEDEIEFEQLCDEERYMELNTEPSEMGSEEEVKRSSRIFAQIPFSYGEQRIAPSNQNNAIEECKKFKLCDRRKVQTNVEKPTNEITDFTPYIHKPELQVPVTMTTPATERMHNIILKTARHVTHKGNQLEIVIRAKQQFNASFDFLSFEHFLNPYYKHLKNLVAIGTINQTELTQEHSKASPALLGNVAPPQHVSIPDIPEQTSDNQVTATRNELQEQTADCSSSSSSEETELHPSLRTSANSKFKPIPKLKAKRRQKAKLFLQKIQKTENTRETEQIHEHSPIHYQGYSTLTPPPPDIQQLIDKVAFQTANSKDNNIERHLKEGGNSIYDFLYPSNEYNAYYKLKKKLLEKHIKRPEENKQSTDSSDKRISFSLHNSTGILELNPKVYLGDDSSPNEDDCEKTQELKGVDNNNNIEVEELRGGEVRNERRKRAAAEFMKKVREKKCKQNETEYDNKKIFKQSAVHYTTNIDQVIEQKEEYFN